MEASNLKLTENELTEIRAQVTFFYDDAWNQGAMILRERMELLAGILEKIDKALLNLKGEK